MASGSHGRSRRRGQFECPTKAIVETAVRTRLFLEHVDAYLLALPSLVNRQKRALLPIVRERIQLADALSRYLGQLGLERKARDLTPTLAEIRQQYVKPTDGEG